MKNVHFDLEANECELRARADESFAAAANAAKSEDDHRFVDIQNRLRDLSILPRLETMRAINDGVPVEMVVVSSGVKIGTALWNIANLTGVPLLEVVRTFVECVGETVGEMEGMHEAGETSNGESILTPSREIYTTSGNA